MRIFYIFLSAILVMTACKKDGNKPPEAFRGKYAGRFYVEKAGVNYNISNVSIRFDGWEYEFGISDVANYPNYNQGGKGFFLTPPDKITFNMLLPTATQLKREYKYAIKEDSLIFINTISDTEREYFRLKRVP